VDARRRELWATWRSASRGFFIDNSSSADQQPSGRSAPQGKPLFQQKETGLSTEIRVALSL
jgi:hypothetical protein